MNYELYMLNQYNCKEVVQKIYVYVRDSGVGSVSIEEDSEGATVSCKYFTFFIHYKDEDEDIKEREKEYNIELNQTFSIQLFGNTFDNGVEFLFMVLGYLMKSDISQNMILIENGDDAIFLKKAQEILVEKHMDIYQTENYTEKLFALLSNDYTQKEIQKF